ncbi:MAG: hypothetical protein R2798_00165 [Chitinophagales bacterium]|nr:hypothetical protein [Bacteroidota bacterium]MCB9043813.1 hypothetical protein [Chitinophagales bacterium]
MLDPRENVFKQLGADKKPPENLKSEVMGTIGMLRHIFEIINLFTFNQANSYGKLLQDYSKINKRKKDE